MFNQFLDAVCAPLLHNRRKVSSIPWRKSFGSSSTMKGLLNRILFIVFGHYSREYCVASHLLVKKILQLVKTMGLYGTMLYLKQCSICLMAAFGDSPPLKSGLSCPVSLTRAGYPRIIPSFHRRKIYKKDDVAEKIVHFYLSAFAMYRLIEIAKPIDKTTFLSITKPCECLDSVIEVVGEIKSNFIGLISTYIPSIRSIPLNQGMKWKPVWSTLPNLSLWRAMVQVSPPNERPKQYKRGLVTPFPVISLELGCYGSLLQFIHSRGEQWSSGILWPSRIRFPFDLNNKIWSGSDLDFFEKCIGPTLPVKENFHPGVAPRLSSGRLAQVIQGGGKRRIFAIGNYINQRLLRPFHCWLMRVLRTIPMDGTFNQLRPLDRLIGCQKCFSFDLKAATDRWPLVFLFEITALLFDRSFASATVNSALATNIFDIPFVRGNKKLSFIAGQPLGYYSSWPLFALCHHILMWFAADKVYPGCRFDRYAILGDDVVVTDEAVAREYAILIGRLGIQISLPKSLISASGAGEFAKRYRVKGLSKDLSPISSRLILASNHLLGLLALTRTYNLSFKTAMRVGGAGYRQMATMKFRRNSQWQSFYLMFTAAHWNMDLSAFLGRGNPLNPYLFGYLVDYLIEKTKPKDIRLMPVELYSNPKEEHFSEYSLIRSWMVEWLAYVKWHAIISQTPEVKLEEFFLAPIVQQTWFVQETEVTWSRFGLLWRLYNLVAQKGLQWSPGIIGESSDSHTGKCDESAANLESET